ncbi:hypothetical protein J2Z76_000451 [Sedimentibacter acidaminivorans]|uniref:DUF7210 domain-containing protein n=1 Tax=Sedimentibacter acidaminivorans TaxID=913099 RepID=A0ABS4GA87_9FIRM|nr:hypothetical protein [Sedimentibacter acidaminivorans]MBP1924598.1 hypothetical protein [Sedimentibacter acidaminivorans]
MIVIAKENIRHNRKEYVANDRIELNEKDAERLVNLGVAFFPEIIHTPSDNEDGENKNLNTDGGNVNSTDDGNNPDTIELTPEQAAAEIEKLFNYNELKDAAKKVGLEFAGNISKANLISLIIEQNKAEAIFDLVEEE